MTLTTKQPGGWLEAEDVALLESVLSDALDNPRFTREQDTKIAAMLGLFETCERNGARVDAMPTAEEEERQQRPAIEQAEREEEAWEVTRAQDDAAQRLAEQYPHVRCRRGARHSLWVDGLDDDGVRVALWRIDADGAGSCLSPREAAVIMQPLGEVVDLALLAS